MARAELQWALSKQRAKELTCNKKSAIHEMNRIFTKYKKEN